MSVLIFILMLLVLVVGHEFGHLIAAKRAGMKVLEFGVGFPPKLWSKRVGETEYSVNALPFGGFVKIFGEDTKEALADERAFLNRSRLSQAFVMFAGPFANVVLAFVLSTVAFMVGVPSAIDDAMSAYASDTRVLAIEVVEGSPADVAGILPGDRIVSLTVSGVPTDIVRPEMISSVVDDSEDVLVTVQRGEEQFSYPVTPRTGVIEEEPDRFALGLATVLVGTIALPPHQAIAAGFFDTVQDIQLVFWGLISLLGQAFTLSADLSTVSGPVGIAYLAGEAVGVGLGSILAFAAIISVNLAIINLLPFPALDGGRLALLGVETVIRKRVPHTVANAINMTGFALLILLMVAVTYNDIVRLWS